MSDTTTTAQPQTDEGGGEDPKGLRKQLETAQQELKEIKQEVRSYKLRDAGIPERSREAVSKLYDGEWDDPTKIREFAEANGFALEEANSGPQPGSPDDPEEQQARQRQQRLEQARSGAEPPAPDPHDPVQQADQAEADGDFERQGQLLAQAVMEQG